MNQLRMALLIRYIANASLIPFIPAILHFLEVMYAIIIATLLMCACSICFLCT